MDVNDNAGFLNKRAAFESIASKLAPTGGLMCPDIAALSSSMVLAMGGDDAPARPQCPKGTRHPAQEQRRGMNILFRSRFSV
jgi:hypothetical protein